VVSYEVEYPGKAKNRQGIFVRESQLFLFGGNSSLGQHDFAAENFLAEAFRFDLGTLGFEPLAPFPVQRQSMQTLVSGEHGYALGGFGIEGG
jgi:hypothetical protein